MQSVFTKSDNKNRKVQNNWMGRTLGNAWPLEPRLFTHSRELWRYKIEEMSVKIGINFFGGYKEVVRVCLVWDVQNANYIA